MLHDFQISLKVTYLCQNYIFFPSENNVNEHFKSNIMVFNLSFKATVIILFTLLIKLIYVKNVKNKLKKNDENKYTQGH